MPQPPTLMSAPVMKPRRRPTLAIHSDIGIVATADPSTYVVAPSVATALASTSEYPTSPFIVMSLAASVKSSAWQQASRKTLRYEVVMAV
jgi:hypothetical protein